MRSAKLITALSSKIKISAALLLITNAIYAQFVDYGSDPARLKWREINTEHYRVIYPSENSNQAHRYAILLETIYPHERKTMKTKRSSRIPVIIHPYNILSNGMVSWAPKRMELLPAPSADKSFRFPEQTLIAHESRHVAQLERLNQGLFRPFYFVFGEGAMGMSAIFAPQWLLEGEAVVAETALSSSGRGRHADFLMPYRAQASEEKQFSFDKWLMGSYRDYTYDFYALGYMMSAYARTKYGAEVWDNTLNDLSWWKGGLPPFAGALRRNTGLKTKKLFQKAFDSLAIPPEIEKNYTSVSPKNKLYTSYLSPIQTSKGIVAIKNSLDKLSELVIIEANGREKHLTFIGNINSKISVEGNYIYWSEYIPGIRWRHENYSVIKRYDLSTKKIVKLTSGSRYMFPAPNKNGDRIAVFEPLPDGKNTITVLDAVGNRIYSKQILHNRFAKDIIMLDNNDIIAALAGDGTSLMQMNSEGEWHGLLRPQATDIGSLRMNKDGELLFESGYSGVSNLYSFDTISLSVKRLTDARFGAFTPSMTEAGELLFSDYSSKGYEIARITPEKIIQTDEKFDNAHQFITAESLAAQESFNIDTFACPSVSPYTDKAYRRGLNLFNIHTWIPFYVDVDYVAGVNNFSMKDIHPGIMLNSQNSLNTMMGQLAYYHDRNTEENHAIISMNYKGLFPVFQLRADLGGKQRFMYSSGSQAPTKINTRAEINISSYVPLNFTKNHFLHGLQPFVGYYFTNDLLIYPTSMGKSSKNFQYLNAGIYYYRYRKLALRDIFPRYGWQTRIRYLGHPNIDMGQLFLGEFTVFFPGIIHNHGLRLSASHQYQDIKHGQFFIPRRIIDPARGCAYYLYNDETSTFTADYSFALAYPDAALGSLIYIPRIRANLFGDLTRSHSAFTSADSQQFYRWEKLYSYGIEIYFDMFLFRLRYAPIAFKLSAMNVNGKLKGNFSFGLTIN
ncbi:MAG: hypothetical protein LBC98_05170 [Prevotellaceae bacterium]|jgi:hypothetical protein|nr:hypothetical protein [Prevotellaceae bacterium]